MKSKNYQNGIQLIAKTPHGNIPFWGKVATILATDLISYCNKPYYDELCRKGCPNYDSKWSCPPNSPKYVDFSRNHKYLCIVVFGINLCDLEYIKRDYLKVKAGNSILKSRIDKALRRIMDRNEKYISTGSCRLCKPCHKKKNEPCAHPMLRTFSYEAMGIDVSAMVKEVFDLELFWYEKGSPPEYTCVVAGLLSNECNMNQRISEVISEYK